MVMGLKGELEIKGNSGRKDSKCIREWNVTTLIWQASNDSFFAVFYFSCLDMKALLALSQLEISAYLPSRCRRKAMRAVIYIGYILREKHFKKYVTLV